LTDDDIEFAESDVVTNVIQADLKVLIQRRRSKVNNQPNASSGVSKAIWFDMAAS
jgi:hypothetical protein